MVSQWGWVISRGRLGREGHREGMKGGVESSKWGIWEVARWTAGSPLVTVNSRNCLSGAGSAPCCALPRFHSALISLSPCLREWREETMRPQDKRWRRDELSPFAPCILEVVHSMCPYSLSLIILQLGAGQELVFSLHAGHGFTRELLQETTMHNPACYYCYN